MKKLHYLLLGIFCGIQLLHGAQGWRAFFRGRLRNGLLGAPNVVKNYTLPKDEWFDQLLDHSKPTLTQTWKQRYFTNDSFYVPGGPVFLMIGGEGTASPLWMVEGQWIEYAKQYHALCFQLEHRFYGASRPKGDLSIKNLEYLTSEQALGDLSHFIVSITVKYELPPETKWIAFGGSYPGSLAAWLRAKYPHLVHAAVSASAPLLAKADFREYFRVVEDDLVVSADSCEKAVKEATEQINLLLNHPIGQQTINNLFQLCDPLDIDESNDVSNLYESLAGNIAGVAQYNKDNRKFEGARDANITLDTICDMMRDESIGTPAHRYAAVNRMLLNAYGEECLDYKYDRMIEDLEHDDWDSPVASGGERQWLYQTCTEFGFFQTSSLTAHVFGDRFPLDFYVQQCTDTFGRRFNRKLVMEGILRTNREYGDLHIRTSRVVFVHGSFDPWHALGITKTLHPDSPAIYITGTAHCADMYPSAPTDPPQLVAARQKIGSLIGQWLKED